MSFLSTNLPRQAGLMAGATVVALSAAALFGCSDKAPMTAIAPATATVAGGAQSGSAHAPSQATGVTSSATAPAAATSPAITAGASPAGASAGPNCANAAKASPEQTEGPFWKANSPERSSLLEAGFSGTKLTLTGYVLTRSCKPVAGAVLDFWQADDKGSYDNSGFKGRGRQTAGQQGAFKLDTIVPGLYTGRTEHLHVKVGAPGAKTLTTQLYFPGVKENDRDGIFNAALLMVVTDAPGGGKNATFTFVLDIP